MQLKRSREIIQVLISEIDTSDKTYASSALHNSDSALKDSISRVGILSPVKLEAVARGYRVIDGFRRIHAARETGSLEVPAMLFANADPLQLFRAALHENSATRTYSQLDCALVVSKLKRNFKVEESLLIEEFLPVLGLKASKFQLELCLKLSRIPHQIQDVVRCGGLQPELAIKVASWAPEEYQVLLQFLEEVTLGRNKQKEIVDLLDDLRIQLDRSVVEIWDDIGSSRSQHRPDLPPELRFRTVRKNLMALRYPTMTASLKEYEKFVEGLHLPPSIKIEAPRFLEGDRISFTLEARDMVEYGEAVYALDRLRNHPDLVQIFELI